MMRRTFRYCGASLSGNGILAIRREDKNVFERRVPLAPCHVKKLIEGNEVKKVIVQPSSIRCFSNKEYEDVGAEIKEDLSEAGTVVAVKEVPAQLLLPNRSYMFFSHTIKAQSYNMPLLDTIVQKNIRLLDYERILGPDGRIVKFGPFAGVAGMIDTLHALGQCLLLRGFATPFLHISMSKEYRSIETARNDLILTGDLLRKKGFPAELGPLVIGITGDGAVSLAAQQILHAFPCKYIDPEDLPKLSNRKVVDNHNLYVCVIRARDMVEPIDTSRRFDFDHYMKHPEEFRPTFHQRIAPYLHVLVTGHYWEPRFPRLLTIQQAQELELRRKFPLMVLGDITCDIGGSIEFLVKSTTIQNPFFAYDVATRTVIDIADYSGKGVMILGVDHLPAEFPCESSTDFGNGLCPLISKVAHSPCPPDLESMKETLGKELFGSMVTCNGKLTPNFEYIAELRKRRDETAVEKKKRVLIFGAGMTAGPVVETLIDNPQNSVTLVDQSLSQINHLIERFQIEKSGSGLGQDDANTVMPVTANCQKIDEYLTNLIKRSDLVVSMLPAPMHPNIAKVAIEHKVPMLTASYISPGMEELRGAAESQGIPVVNEMGLDPGIDIMTSAQMIHNIRQEGGVITKYVSLCGALPAPENSDGPLGYKFSWSPRGVLTAATRPTRFRVGGHWYDVQGKYLYHLVNPIRWFRGLDLFWVPNGNAEKYANLYNLPDAETEVVVRGTIRYGHFAPAVRAFQELGLLDEANPVKELLSDNTDVITWATYLRRALGANEQENLRGVVAEVLSKKIVASRQEVQKSEAYIALQKQALMGAPTQLPLDQELSQILFSMESLGLLSDHHIMAKNPQGFLLDALCSAMLKKMQYQSHERDFVLMLHEVTAKFAQGKVKTFTAKLSKRGQSDVRSATATTVGLPVGLTAQMMLDGGLRGEKGIVIPTSPKVYNPVLRQLAEHGIEMHETVTEH